VRSRYGNGGAARAVSSKQLATRSHDVDLLERYPAFRRDAPRSGKVRAAAIRPM